MKSKHRNKIIQMSQKTMNKSLKNYWIKILMNMGKKMKIRRRTQQLI